MLYTACGENFSLALVKSVSFGSVAKEVKSKPVDYSGIDGTEIELVRTLKKMQEELDESREGTRVVGAEMRGVVYLVEP